ncbi:hypothetical protein A9958_04105 [Staphylococcus simulans]|nr:hypothetical protein BI282_04105 [Staphylococcus simulans]OFJ77891.1 hypothetical protein HMPREF2846_09385 [Staphylococcus sp. HMSC056G08]OFM18009.1 hypothetical protein HMPREF2713_05915 [Staphylococcus sp. HMSC059E03]OFN22334.1 hypothetical protein HMPREF2603_11935 [Staphylococcus sp. HMSC055C03]OFU78618.1 hypothetical protein HMPREF3110_07025 [Staphylococcus sp. HMSC10C03]OFV04764.1 hypothetical protein HMPREF3124_10080 [Staphylococcus sp. HMSC12H08]OHR55857.1 hypothetical protein HMPREF
MYVRGIRKVETKVGIACTAVNIRKLAALRAENFLNKIKKNDFHFICESRSFYQIPEQLCPGPFHRFNHLFI